MEFVEEINQLSAAKGWTQARVFTRTVGRINELCVEYEYEDLATMEREQHEAMAEPGAGALFRRADAIRTEDPGYSELWEDATPLPS